jgi:hypothetical protein
MDRATAKARLANMVAASSRPVLSDSQVEDLLNLHQVADLNGTMPASDAWTPTWDLNAAAAEGWGWKANTVAGDFTFSADGASYSKADVLAHCAEREAFYAGKVRGSMSIGRWGSRYGLGGDYVAGELIP